MARSKLESLALEVAICAPKTQNGYAYAAKIPWTVIDALREECERVGYDWRAGVDLYVALTKENATEAETRRKAVAARLCICGHVKSEHGHGADARTVCLARVGERDPDEPTWRDSRATCACDQFTEETEGT